MRLAAITTFEALAQHASAIDRFIADDEVDSNVYHQSGYVETFIRHSRNVRDWSVLLFYEGERIDAIAALAIRDTQLPLRLGLLRLTSVRIRQLHFIGNSIACRRQVDLASMFQALENYLLGDAPGFDVGVIAETEIDAPLFAAFAPALGRMIIVDRASSRCEGNYYLDRPGDWDAYLASLSKKSRYNLRRTVRQFGETFGDRVRLERYAGPDRVDAFGAARAEVFAESWQGAMRAATAEDSAWIRDENRALAAAGCFDSFVLYGGEEPVAFLRGYRHKDCYYYEEIGYKQRWAGVSPGSVLTFLFLERVLAEPIPPYRVDFGYGDNLYKHKFGNCRVEASDAWLYRRGTRGARLLALHSMLDNGYHGFRALAKRLRIDAHLRRRLKGRKSEKR